MSPVAEWWQHETFIPLDWSPPPMQTPPRRRWLRALLAVVLVVLVAASAVLGWLAWSEHRSVQRDRAVMRVQSAQLTLVANEMNSLRAQISTLRTQTGHLQSQLDSRGQLLSSAGTVAGELQACIDASGKASTDFLGLFTGTDHKAESICSAAEADYQQLLSDTGSAH